MRETGIKVGDIMTRNFISIKPDTNLIDAAKTMIKKRVGSLILEEKGELKGFITERDIIWALVKKSKKDLRNIKAKDISMKKIPTIKTFSKNQFFSSLFKFFIIPIFTSPSYFYTLCHA